VAQPPEVNADRYARQPVDGLTQSNSRQPSPATRLVTLYRKDLATFGLAFTPLSLDRCALEDIERAATTGRTWQPLELRAVAANTMLRVSCHCGLPEPYEECCGRFHAGGHAPTAELLMRSRYSAFVVGDAAYLLRTWHPDTRPRRLRLDPRQRWTGLEIVERSGGGLFDTEGVVAFRAHSSTGTLAERSTFARFQKHWVYVGGTHPGPA
jgi:SEC-C motif-containing protein